MTSIHIHLPEIGDMAAIGVFFRKGFSPVPFRGWHTGSTGKHPEVDWDRDKMSPEAYGCLVSHYLAMKKLASEPVLICESDALPNASSAQIEGVVRKAPQDWDLIFLYPPRDHVIRRINAPQDLTLMRAPNRSVLTCTHGYIVRPSFAPVLCDAYSRMSLYSDRVFEHLDCNRYYTRGYAMTVSERQSTITPGGSVGMKAGIFYHRISARHRYWSDLIELTRGGKFFRLSNEDGGKYRRMKSGDLLLWWDRWKPELWRKSDQQVVPLTDRFQLPLDQDYRGEQMRKGCY